MRTITDRERANFDTLRLAAAHDDLALIVVRERATGLERVALAAVAFDGSEYAVTPFALMVDGDPFELLDPPVPSDDRSELDASGRDCDGQRDRGPDVLEQARELGRQAGRDAGSWAADGNTSAEHIRKVLAMLDVGDPAADEFLPRTPNLSGEYADDVTAHSLASELLGNDQTPEDRDAISDAWEDGVRETFEDACVSTLRGFLPDDAAPSEG